MTKDAVVIPCFSRPEYLFLCLERIAKARDFNEGKTYLFAIDKGHDPNILPVISEWASKHKVPATEIQRDVNEYSPLVKQSFNVLDALVQAARICSRYVYLIEEDVMIATDFFLWHNAVHEHATEKQLFCSIATRNNNRKIDEFDGDKDEYYLSSDDYQSLGVCFHRKVVDELIKPHANREYFLNTKTYCQMMFPYSNIGAAYTEQDGLIRRIQEGGRFGLTAYPFFPRGFHAGLYGYNRGDAPISLSNKTFQQRVDYIRSIIFDDERMRLAAKRKEWYEDSRPCELDLPAYSPYEVRYKYIDFKA